MPHQALFSVMMRLDEIEFINAQLAAMKHNRERARDARRKGTEIRNPQNIRRKELVERITLLSNGEVRLYPRQNSESENNTATQPVDQSSNQPPALNLPMNPSVDQPLKSSPLRHPPSLVLVSPQ